MNRVTAAALASAALLIFGNSTQADDVNASKPAKEAFLTIRSGIEWLLKEEKPIPETEIQIENFPVEEIPETILEDWEAELIAVVTMAEAEGEPEYGKRLVIDTILNRVDSPEFPNDIWDVIYQPGAFSSTFDGRMDVCYVRDDILQLVYEEAEWRCDYDVHYFRAGWYSNYGEPLYQVGNHYFSR